MFFKFYAVGFFCLWLGWRLGWWRGRKNLEGQFKKDLESKYGPLPDFKNSDGSSPFDPNYSPFAPSNHPKPNNTNPSNTNLNDFNARVLNSVGKHWEFPRKGNESSADYRKRLHTHIKENRK